MTDVSITMIGGSTSGKTTYMLAMYEDMRYGYGGFTFGAIDPDVDIELSDKWAQLEAEDRKWPQRNDDDPREYDFNLLYAFERFMTFRWIDYAGGMILTRAGELNQQLGEYINKSDCILIVTPGNFLFDIGRSGAEARRGEKNMHVADIKRLIANAINDEDMIVKPSFIVLITKYDLFKSRFRQVSSEGGEALKDYTMRCVEDVYPELFAREAEIDVLICPVTLGEELADDAQHGAIDPQNVHIPVLFAYLEHARRLREAFRSMEEDLRNDRAEKAGSALSRWWNSNDIRSIDEEMKEIEQRLRQIETRLDVVREAMPDEAIVIRNGEQQ